MLKTAKGVYKGFTRFEIDGVLVQFLGRKFLSFQQDHEYYILYREEDMTLMDSVESDPYGAG